LVSPATVGLAIAEGKLILERLQRSVVTSQIHRHGASIKSCLQCGKAFRTKGYYQYILRRVFLRSLAQLIKRAQVGVGFESG
jgi:hypothetical protein